MIRSVVKVKGKSITACNSADQRDCAKASPPNRQKPQAAASIGASFSDAAIAKTVDHQRQGDQGSGELGQESADMARAVGQQRLQLADLAMPILHCGRKSGHGPRKKPGYIVQIANAANAPAIASAAARGRRRASNAVTPMAARPAASINACTIETRS